MEVMKYRQACCLDICIIMCTCLVVERRKRDREREVFSFSLDLGGGDYKERSGGADVFIGT